MDTPYYIEDNGTKKNIFNGHNVTEYALRSSADGTVVVGTDLALLYKIADLLNEEFQGQDVHR